MKKTAALLAILTLFSTGAFANEKLTLETQGHFAAGGITIQREGFPPKPKTRRCFLSTATAGPAFVGK